MEYIRIDELKPHPKNSYFFDDMIGEKWEEFLESVETRGVIEPVIIASDKTIVSGHQRVRACKELGIDKVKCIVRNYDNEDDLLLDLLDTNEKQRGTIGGSTVKLGRRIKEYERIYGIKHGGDRSKSDIVGFDITRKDLTQKDLADKLGISVDTLSNAKKLASLPKEIQDAVETGLISASTASRTIATLPEDQQIELINQFPATKKITQKQLEQKIADIKKRDERIEELVSSIDNASLLVEKVPELQEWIDTGIMTKEILQEIAKQLPPDVYDSLSFVKVIDNTPSDYQTIKDAKEKRDKDYKELEKQRDDKVKEITELKDRIKDLETRNGIGELQKKLEEEASYFQIRTYNYIQQNGGSVWITEKLNDLPEKTRKEFISSIYAIDAFAKQMIENIGGYGIE